MNDILVISADKTLSKRLKTTLEQNGLGPVTEINESKLAIEYCKQHKPTLMVIDLFMAETSGVDLVQKLKQSDDSKVMLLTRVRTRHLLERAYRYGADDVLTLPLSDETFLSFVYQRLGRQELAPAAKS